MLCQRSLHESCGMGRCIVVMKLICSLGHCDCDGHTIHKFSQRRLTADWLDPQESDCSRMHSKVFSDWLPRYVKATRPVLEIFRMAGYFPESPSIVQAIWPVHCVPKLTGRHVYCRSQMGREVSCFSGQLVHLTGIITFRWTRLAQWLQSALSLRPKSLCAWEQLFTKGSDWSSDWQWPFTRDQIGQVADSDSLQGIRLIKWLTMALYKGSD
jgi:hypothetical protein